MANRLDGQIALVTGAASGIAKAIANAFADQGAAVAVLDLNLGGAHQTAADIAARGGRSLAMHGDVGNASDVDRAVERTVEAFAGPTVLVNNAGIILQAPALDTTDDQWDRIITTNLTRCFLACRAAARTMIDHGGNGRIINVSSIHAQLSEPNAAAYSGSQKS